jgi:phthalate 4,5-cis-dihydrodiol dehydrogenase
MTVRIGIAGLGSAGRTLPPQIAARSDVVLSAIADPSAEARADLPSRDVRACADIASMLENGAVDAVYLATPTPLHAEQAIQVMEAGRHVLVEKPMAIDLDQSAAMIRAAEKAGVILMVGHSHAYDPPIRKLHELIASGRWGRPRMMQSLCYTDWMYRPRRPDELRADQGGGVTLRQGAHQFDILRLLGGGLVTSVRAATGAWDAKRPGIGAHTAFLQFQGGASASAVYNGYGAFSSAELSFGIGESGWPEPAAEMGRLRRAFHRGPGGDETAAKRNRTMRSRGRTPPHQPFFGVHIVSCDGGDLRQSPDGIFVYDENGRSEIDVPERGDGRATMLDDFLRAIAMKRPPRHDGPWGQATLELSLAVLASAAERRELTLARQVPVHD